MLQWVKNIAEFSDNTYGERRIQKALNALDFPVGCRKTAQLMKEANVWGRYKKKYKEQPIATTRSLSTIIFNVLIKHGCKTLHTYGPLKDGCI